MIWLASFPRSGNTFFRNVLYEVYGLASSTFHQDPNREVDEKFRSYPVVKTHLLPHQLPDQEAKSVYIIRDGRDSLVSIAHHRKDIVEPGTDFQNNLLEAILSPGGSNFGGWRRNVEEWIQKADVVIHFEELIADPIGQIERLRAIMDLPQPNLEKLPTFEKLKFGSPKYGAGKPSQSHLELAKRHFRKGKVGSWKKEMPANLEKLFWNTSGKLMHSLGYSREEGYTGAPINLPASDESAPVRKVLIEATKLSGTRDGVQRYLSEITGHLPVVLGHFPELEIGLLVKGHIRPVKKILHFEQKYGVKAWEKVDGEFSYESLLLGIKKVIQQILPKFIYRPLSKFYREGPFRRYLAQVRDRKMDSILGKDPATFDAYDLIHVPLPQNMHWVNKLDKPVVVTAHDFTHHLFPDYHTAANVEIAENGMQAAMDRDANWICISNSTARDLQAIYEVDQQKVHLCYEGANRGKFKKAAGRADFSHIRKRYQLPDGPFFLCLSTIEPRKNLLNTIKAFLHFLEQSPEQDIHLVICGKTGWKTKDLFEELREDHPKIHFTGFVEDEHLPLFYAHAIALCYVSHYEGFGLPMLEAMSCGTPVIYGNNSSMPEVAGEGGLPADPKDFASIAQQMEKLVLNPEKREALAEAAWKQSNTFSWWMATFETLLIYQRILDNQG